MAWLQPSREAIAARAAFQAEDHAVIARCRGPHNRLGLAYQMAFVRLQGRLPGQHPLEIHDDLLAFVVDELHLDPDVIQTYARRQPTVSAHQEQIRVHLGLKLFSPTARVDLEAFLLTEAYRLEQSSALSARAQEFLRERRILLPADSTLKRLVGEQWEKARQTLFSRMMEKLSAEAPEQLDALLVVGSDRTSPLQRLKEPPGFPSPRALLQLCDKLDQIDATGIRTQDLTWLNGNLQRAMARQVETASVYRLRQLKAPRRYTVLACFLQQTYCDTIDQLVEMHARLITDTQRRAQHELDEDLKKQRGSLRATLTIFQKVVCALLDEGVEAEDVRAAVFRIVSPEKLQEHLQEAEVWMKGIRSDTFVRVLKRFPYLRQFSPALLKHLRLRVEPTGHPALLKAVEMLRQMNAQGTRKVPEGAPLDFLPARLQPFLQNNGQIDRRAYECAVLTALRDEIRQGNVWIQGSKRFGRLEDFFLPDNQWQTARPDFFRQAGLPEKPGQVAAYLTDRLSQAYDRFLELLPHNAFVTLDSEGWQLSTDSSEALSPEEEEKLKTLGGWLEARIRSIRLPDLLLEVDNELYWTRHFIPLPRREQRLVEAVCQVVATVMAYGCNIGPDTMSKLTNGVSYAQIQRLADWHFHEDTLKAALAQIVNAIARLDTTRVWGEAKTSSSDGQRYLFPRKVLQRTYSHRLGAYALEFYTFVADNYAPFYNIPIECTERDAAYVLDGLLYHQADIDPEEHYTDTHGYTELNFAAFAMFGKRFCPRIRGLQHQWIYRPDQPRDYGPLTPVVNPSQRVLHTDWIVEYWDRIAQFFASFASGHTTASVALKRLVAFGPKNHFFRAVRELGRVFKTEFVLDYLSQPTLRRRIRHGLLKEEELHALARSVHYGRRGRADQRDFRQQTSTASCLVLILAAIVYWQIREIERVLTTSDPEAEGIDLRLLPHVSPIGWENVLLYGEYVLNRALVHPYYDRQPTERNRP